MGKKILDGLVIKDENASIEKVEVDDNFMPHGIEDVGCTGEPGEPGELYMKEVTKMIRDSP